MTVVAILGLIKDSKVDFPLVLTRFTGT